MGWLVGYRTKPRTRIEEVSTVDSRMASGRAGLAQA
jgi:hypothetical protein